MLNWNVDRAHLDWRFWLIWMSANIGGVFLYILGVPIFLRHSGPLRPRIARWRLGARSTVARIGDQSTEYRRARCSHRFGAMVDSASLSTPTGLVGACDSDWLHSAIDVGILSAHSRAIVVSWSGHVSDVWRDAGYSPMAPLAPSSHRFGVVDCAQRW